MKTDDAIATEDLAAREARLKEQLSSKATFSGLLSQKAPDHSTDEDSRRLHFAVRNMAFLSNLLVISSLILGVLHLFGIVPSGSKQVVQLHLQLLTGMAIINIIAVTVIRALLTRITALDSRIEGLHRKIESSGNATA